MVQDEGPAARPGADWGRAAKGIELAGLGLLLLLNTTGALPWSFWVDAVALWPVLVVSLGLRIVFERSRAPWLLLLGPALVLGSLGWLASGGRPRGTSGPSEAAVVARPEGARRVSLEAGLAGARLRLATVGNLPADRLVDGRSVNRPAGTRLDARTEDDAVEVRLGGRRRGVAFLSAPRELWDLRLPADLPLRLQVRGAGVGGDLDLATGVVQGLGAEGVLIGLDVRLPAPREQTQLRVSGVFNSLTLRVPEGTPVRVRGPGLPFNLVDRGVPGTAGRPGYDVRVQGIFSVVEVLTDPSIPPEPPPVAPSVPEVSLPLEAPLPAAGRGKA